MTDHTARFHVTGQVVRTVTGHGDTPLAAIKDFLANGGQAPDWAWEGDDEDSGGSVVWLCENCGLPIYDDEPYFHDSDGVYWHQGEECST